MPKLDDSDKTIANFKNSVSNEEEDSNIGVDEDRTVTNFKASIPVEEEDSNLNITENKTVAYFDSDAFNKKMDKKENLEASAEEESTQNALSSPDKTVQASINDIKDDFEEEDSNPEKTEIFALDNQPEEESTNILVDSVKIKILEGEKLEEFPLRQEITSIGRAKDNDITIDNKTISQKHCEIIKTQNTYTIKDLKSENGIEVNNKRTFSKILKSRDTILIGKVKVEFIDLSAEQEEFELTRSVGLDDFIQTKKKKFIIITIATILVLLLGISILVKQSNEEKEIRLINEKTKKEILKSKISENYFDGINSYKLQEWDSAISSFDKAIKLKPDYIKAKKYKKIAIKEKENRIILKNSKKLFSEKKYPATLLELKKIEENSSYYKDAENLRKNIEKTLSEKKEEKKEDSKKEEKEKALEKLRAKAKALYRSAYKKERRRPTYAKRDYRKILSILPENEEIYQNAKTRLERLIKLMKPRRARKKKTKTASPALQKKAKDMYLSAYQRERINPKSAKRKYRKIMSILPSSDTIYKKAKKRLGNLK